MKGKSGGKDFCGFALPGMFCFFAVVILPFIYGIYLTLTDWNGVSAVKHFVGAANFLSVLKDAQFWSSLVLTFKYVIFVVIIVNVLAFAIAYLLTRGIKGQNFFRAGFFTPNLIGGLVLGYIWQFVFSRVFVGIGEATGWVKLKSIILPLMMSSITICLFLTLSRAFMVYDVNLSLTAGAPYGTTEMAAMHVYEKAFTSRQFGVGQAEALILFVIVAIISGIQVYLTKRQEVEA